jgi:hypothetical protein
VQYLASAIRAEEDRSCQTGSAGLRRDDGILCALSRRAGLTASTVSGANFVSPAFNQMSRQLRAHVHKLNETMSLFSAIITFDNSVFAADAFVRLGIGVLLLSHELTAFAIALRSGLLPFHLGLELGALADRAFARIVARRFVGGHGEGSRSRN